MESRLEDTLAERLREVAREKKLPLSHVADRAGVARSYFWRLLDGSNSATLAVLQRIAEALTVEPLELLVPSATEPTTTATPTVPKSGGSGTKAKATIKVRVAPARRKARSTD